MIIMMINIAKINRIKAPKETPTTIPIMAPFEAFIVVVFLMLFVLIEFLVAILDECRRWREEWWDGVEITIGGFEILAIWIIEENPPKTKIWANNSPAINPVKFEQVNEKEETELTWQLGFDVEDDKDE